MVVLVLSLGIAWVIEMAQVFSQLPKEAKAMLTWVQESAEAWRLLKEKYEDAHIAVSSVIHLLQTVKLPDGPPHDKVEA